MIYTTGTFITCDVDKEITYKLSGVEFVGGVAIGNGTYAEIEEDDKGSHLMIYHVEKGASSNFFITKLIGISKDWMYFEE